MKSYADLAMHVAEFGCIHLHDAERVVAAYRKANLVTSNVHDGVNVKHGALLDKETIRCALRNIHAADTEHRDAIEANGRAWAKADLATERRASAFARRIGVQS